MASSWKDQGSRPEKESWRSQSSSADPETKDIDSSLWRDNTNRQGRIRTESWRSDNSKPSAGEVDRQGESDSSFLWKDKSHQGQQRGRTQCLWEKEIPPTDLRRHQNVKHPVSRFGTSETENNTGNAISSSSRGQNRHRREYPEKRIIFGIKHLQNLLTLTTDEVLRSLDQDLVAWKEFIESDELSLKYEGNLLLLLMQLLADKICIEDSQLPKQRIGILIKTVNTKFFEKISQKCGQLQTGTCTPSLPSIRLRERADYKEIDVSPMTFFTNLYKYIGFTADKMPTTAATHLSGIIKSAFGTLSILSITEEIYNPIVESYKEMLVESTSLLKKKQQEEVPKKVRIKPGFSELQQLELDSMSTPNDFREMSIIPTVQELLSKDEIFLRPNKISGAYNDADHYLDVQFRLLREDLIRPLREGIQEFIKHKEEYLTRKKKMPLGSIRIHPNVNIVKTELIRQDFVYKVQLAERSYNRIQWEKSKRLLPGSLIVFTPDYFKTAFFGVVMFHKIEELKTGVVSFLWEGPKPKWNPSMEYIMIESEVYFEAYRYTLEILQSLELGSFPMAKFIVEASSEVGPPKYLSAAVDDFMLILKDEEKVKLSPLVEDQWPTSENLGLDFNQREAFKAAVTREFAIIQGPPGTGKTFIGLKLAEFFLNNRKHWKTKECGPIVVVCYTNHALDQFLEGILDIKIRHLPNYPVRNELDFIGPLTFEETVFRHSVAANYPAHIVNRSGFIGPLTLRESQQLAHFQQSLYKLSVLDSRFLRSKKPSIIRVGGRCQSKILEEYSLFNIVQNRSFGMPENYQSNLWNKKDLISSLRSKRYDLMQQAIELRDINGIINFEELSIWKKLESKYGFTRLWWNFKEPNWFGVSDSAMVKIGANPDGIDTLIRSWFPALSYRATTIVDPIKTNPTQQPKTAIGDFANDNADDKEDKNENLDELLEKREIDDQYLAELDSRAHGRFNFSDRAAKKFNSLFIPKMDVTDNRIDGIEKEINQLRDLLLDPFLETDWRILLQVFEETRITLIDLEKKLTILKNRKTLLQKIFGLYKSKVLQFPDQSRYLELIREDEDETIDLSELSMSQKWQLYFAMIEYAISLSDIEESEIEHELIEEEQKLQDLQRYGEMHVLKQADVIGMTTTGAAKYNHLLRSVKSKIVIVEEAAEVLESHIVTCITENCEHLILIGDHLQLQPSTTVFELSRKFNLNTSLFERMLNNNLNCYQLKVQHRMRPEISNLITGTIYQELENHENVNDYPDVLGIAKNLYFVSHNQLEKADTESMSKSNVFEADYMAGLCRHLILQGYAPGQITVLTTYTGQMFLLKQTIRQFAMCKEIRVTCVDNYQGEENDIILLSLVRSNLENKIGFLNIENRVCVALSRAKHGLFIVGNMELLASRSELWKTIRGKLSVDSACGSGLPLKCQIHGSLTNAESCTDFQQKSPEGGCLLSCDVDLKCGHKCTRVCHLDDREHTDEKYTCDQTCLKNCTFGHPCTFQCWRLCPPCPTQVEKMLDCKHTTSVACHERDDDVKCQEIVEKALTCGHDAHIACHIDQDSYDCQVLVDQKLPCNHMKESVTCCTDIESINCNVEVIKNLPCGHEKLLECHVDQTTIKCEVVVSKELPCKHIKEEIKCYQDIESITCEERVVKTLACGHTKRNAICRTIADLKISPEHKKELEEAIEALNISKEKSKKKKYIDIEGCTHKCTKRLNCGHSCTKTCHFEDDPDHLEYECQKECEKSCQEGHPCTTKHKCWKPCPPCKIQNERTLQCGHTALLDCFKDPEKTKCNESCKIILQCGHKCASICSVSPCPPCMIPVQKIIESCQHEITYPCGDKPSQAECEKMAMSVNGVCSHTILVPCKIMLTATRSDISTYCTETCGSVFTEDEGGCGHQCAGNCASCIQGKFHEKCKEKCGKTLVCGHVCDFPCSQVCPSCSKNCEMKCEHSECGNKCGTPCQDCNEKCEWQCDHKKCTKLCKELCDRESCDEPCRKTIEKCGHPCIGFCGEPCPSECLICDEEELCEIFLGHEDQEDLRFVLLPDCNHAIEVKGLTEYLNQKSEEIGAKRCPKCLTVIGSCRRFNNILKKCLRDVCEVRLLVFGNQTKNYLKNIRSRVEKTLLYDRQTTFKWKNSFPNFQQYLIQLVFTITRNKKGRDITQEKLVDQYTLESVNRILDFAEGAVDIIMEWRIEIKPELKNDLLSRYNDLFSRIMARKLPLSKKEFIDIEREINRLFDLNQAYIRRSHLRFYDGRTDAIMVYNKILDIILKTGSYLGEDKKILHALFCQLEEILKTGICITEFEKREITGALGMTQGHWFKCPNGHPYVITECGGAMEEGKCNECGAKIGGSNHRLLGDNSLAPEMDGAIAPAWPGTLH